MTALKSSYVYAAMNTSAGANGHWIRERKSQEWHSTTPGSCGRSQALRFSNLDVRALRYSALGPVAAPAGERDLRIRIRLDEVGRVDDLELLDVSGFAHVEPL